MTMLTQWDIHTPVSSDEYSVHRARKVDQWSVVQKVERNIHRTLFR